MSCRGTSAPALEEMQQVSRLVSTRLVAFLTTLRDNGFVAGLRESQDAARLMAAGYAERPALLRSAFKHLFSANKSDWERFDGLFDAFWLGKRVKSRSLTGLDQSRQQSVLEGPAGQPNEAKRRRRRHRSAADRRRGTGWARRRRPHGRRIKRGQSGRG